MKSQPRILVHVSLPEIDQTATFWNFWQIANHGWPLANVPPGRTDQQRNMAIEALLRSDGTHLVLLDHDHFHAPGVIAELAERVMEDHTRLVITGMSYNWHTGLVAATIFDNETKMPIQFDPSLYEPGTVVEVFSTSPAVAIISREVFERLQPPWFGYTYRISQTGQVMHPGTDFLFNGKCREADISLWLDTGIISPHITHSTIPPRERVVSIKGPEK